MRAIPDAKFHAPNPDGSLGGVQKNSLPYDVWKTMSPHGQHVTRGVVAPPGHKVEIPWGGILVSTHRS